MIEATPLIYIVDDDRSVRKSLKRLMKSAGLKAKTLASAEDFLNSGYQDNPGCLILDVRMPDLSGLELQKQLAATGSKIPIIFIAAHEDEKACNAAMEAGAVAFLQKPFDDQTLLGAIHLAFERLIKLFPGVNS
jgi:FixJ family two-component response regulator